MLDSFRIVIRIKLKLASLHITMREKHRYCSKQLKPTTIIFRRCYFIFILVIFLYLNKFSTYNIIGSSIYVSNKHGIKRKPAYPKQFCPLPPQFWTKRVNLYIVIYVLIIMTAICNFHIQTDNSQKRTIIHHFDKALRSETSSRKQINILF